MLCQVTLPGLSNAIFLPASAYGAMPCVKPDGLTNGQCGQEAVLANLSARQAMEKGLLTSGTCGLRFSTSLASADLQSALANKLRKSVDLDGSILFDLTWSVRATPVGVLLPALLASVRHTSGKGYIGAPPTLTARDHRGRMSMETLRRREVMSKRGVNLQEFMQRRVGHPGYLNPELARLWMGLPPEWDASAVMAMDSMWSRRSPS